MLYRRRSHPVPARGFTLIEAALATVIIGVAFTAMLELLTRGTIVNRVAAETSTAINLANNVRELTVRRRFTEAASPAWGPGSGEANGGGDTVEDLDGAVINPPIDANGNQISTCPDWTQQVTVRSVDPNLVSSTLGSNSTTAPMAVVTARILRNGSEVYSLSWLVVNTQ